MKKKVKKLTLNRETLGYLGGVVGGGTFPTHGVQCNSDPCGPPGDGGTASLFGTCNSCGVCSGGCGTGGACTLTC